MSHKVERLVNVTVALLEARRPLTFAELRDATGYYAQDDPESARRMFERDKDELRRRGVPIDTRAVDPLGGDEGYIIDRAAYELPDIDLDADEVAALALALQVAGDESTRLALPKLAARAPDPHPLALAIGARMELGADPGEAIAEALTARQPIRFAYRSASGERSERTVDPYAVVHRRGAVYLVGRDHGRDDVRSFRVDRIVDGRARATGRAGDYELPDDLDALASVAGPPESVVDAEVAVAPALAWVAEVRGGVPAGDHGDGWLRYRFPGTNPVKVASWVLGLGPDAELLAPDDVRAEVVRRLEQLSGAPLAAAPEGAG